MTSINKINVYMAYACAYVLTSEQSKAGSKAGDPKVGVFYTV